MQYLSDEWLAAADAAVQDLEPAPAPFAVSYVVTDGPDGQRAYTVDLGSKRVQVVIGVSADVTLRLSWETAVAIARSERSAQRAFLDGDIRIEGDAQALLGHRDELLAVEERLASLRAETTF